MFFKKNNKHENTNSVYIQNALSNDTDWSLLVNDSKSFVVENKRAGVIW